MAADPPAGEPPRLLFLAHRIPYPPNKGDKIRSYNELLFLGRRFRVDLFCFISGPRDQDHIRKLRGLCRSVHAYRRGPWAKLTGLLWAVLRGQAASVGLYRHRGLARNLAKHLASGDYAHIFVFSGQMAQYVPDHLERTVLDLCDVDSHKWDNYADRLPSYLAWFYRREARRLLAFERAAAARARRTILITPSERALFERLGGRGNLLTLPNGVDTGYFRPADGPGEDGRVLFTGAMDYFPNEDGVAWFAQAIFPAVRRHRPGARFVVAGSNPSAKVRALAAVEGVEVTGFVEDMRREQARARVVVVPLRIARGMQNKVLEAMASGKAVVATPMALGGIGAEPGRHLLVADDPADFADKVAGLLADGERAAALGAAARAYIEANFDWGENLSRALLPALGEGP